MRDVVLVTGGTGTLGSQIVPRLRDAGRQVRVLSRHSRPPADGVEYVAADLTTGEGVEVAVQGVDVIVHCAGSNHGDGEKAQSLVRAASKAGTRHIVYISVVGADRVPVVSGVDRAMFIYFASKLDAERVVANSSIPSTTLRATQFHDIILLVAKQLAKLPVVPLPAGMRFQPVDSGEVAARLAELALGEPAGLVPDIAGPKIYSTDELLRAYLQATHQRRLILPLWLPGKAARAIRAGANLSPNRAVGKITLEQFLAEHVGSSSASRPRDAVAVPGH